MARREKTGRPRTMPPRKPKPFAMGRLKARAIRGPRATGEWYWRVELYADGGSTTVYSGWGTLDALTRKVTAEDRQQAMALAGLGERPAAAPRVVPLRDGRTQGGSTS